MTQTPASELPATADIAVIGGGAVGLALAREAKLRSPDSSVVLIEKEVRCGEHASGRNSGVLHAGFYYHADSLKARLTQDLKMVELAKFGVDNHRLGASSFELGPDAGRARDDIAGACFGSIGALYRPAAGPSAVDGEP